MKYCFGITFLLLIACHVPAQTTAFTYQGRLEYGGLPANGVYDLAFALYDSASEGNQQGNAITNTAIAVTNGLFTVTLDFGNQFPGGGRWLEIGVCSNGLGAFTTLAPRQGLTSTPYAIQANNAATAVVAASANSLSATNINGVLADSLLSPNVALRAGGNSFSGPQTINGFLSVASTFRGFGDLRLYAFQGNGSNGTAFVQARDDSGTSSIDLVLRTQSSGGTKDVVRLGASGNVGIGVSAPAFPLSFPDTLGDKISLWGASSNHFGFGIQPNLLQLHTDRASDDIAFGYGQSSNLTETVRIKGNGLMGIGTANPQRLLQVGDPSVTNSQGMIRLASRSGVGLAARSWDIGVPETDDDVTGIGYSFVIDDVGSSGGAPDFMIKYGSGNVGIGTTNPGVKLDVNGAVRATQFLGDASSLTNVPGALPSQVVGTTSIQAQPDRQYDLTSASFVTVNLPTNATVGQVVQVNGLGAGGWQVQAGSGQYIPGTRLGDYWIPRESNRHWLALASSTNGLKLVAADYGGLLYTSADGGNNWTPRATALNWRALASSADGTTLFAAVEYTDSYGVIYRSTNSGVTWTPLPGTSNNRWIDRCLACSADGMKVFASGFIQTNVTPILRGDVWRSTDGGNTWSLLVADHWAPLQGVACSPDGNWVFVSAPRFGTAYPSDGFYRSSDGGTYFPLLPAPAQFFGLAYSANAKLFVAAGDILISTNQGDTWTGTGASTFLRNVATSADGNKLIAGGLGSQLVWSLDGGTTWTNIGPTGNWNGAAISADGSRACAVLENGQIYTSAALPVAGAQGSSGSFIYAGNGIWRPVDLPGRSANVPWSTVTRDAFGNFEAGLIRATGLQVGSASVPNSVGMIQLASRSGAGSAARTWEVGVPETDENLSGTGYSFVVNDLGNGSAPELMVQFGTGNVGIGTTNPSAKLDVNGNINASGSLNLNTASYTGVTAFIRARPGDDIPLAVQGTDGVNLLLVETNGNVTAETFVNSSDRGRKTNFTSVSAANVLDKVASLPIQRWSFKSDATTTHIGPMAQDFYSAFGVGPDDKHITAVDAYGVALAAIQGLNEKIEAGSLRSEARTRSLEQKLQQRETEVTELKSRLEKLERLTMNNK